MNEPSPAARAIVQAFDDRYERCGPFDDNWQELCLAAALRALADYLVPESLGLMHPAAIAKAQLVREDILLIANDLEAS